VRRFLAAGIWLALTVTATAIVWAAVSVVAADVTDRPAPVVAHRDVVVALGGSSAPAGVATTALPNVSPTATTRPAGAVTATTAPVGRGGAPVTAAVTTTTPPPTTTRPPTRTSVAPVTAAPTTAPPPTAPPGATATYSTDGGAVGVACTGFNSIRLVVALPNDGYQAIVTSGGPYFVQVNFVGHGRNLPVGAACVFNVPFEFTQFNQGGTGTPGVPGG
jgi:hypothetical protein